MKKPILILLLALLCPTVYGQYIRLTQYGQPNSLYLNLDQIFNYNSYEHTRWRLGLAYVGNHGKGAENAISIHGFGAYGMEDKSFKYGISAQYRFAGKHRLTLSAEYRHDIEHAASTQLENYQISKITETGNFMTSRYSGIDRLSAGISARITPRAQLSLLYHYSLEHYLFDAVRCRYPLRNGDAPMPSMRFSEAEVKFTYREKLKAHLLLGMEENGGEQPYLRLIAQYKESRVSKRHFPPKRWYDIFAQAGATAGATPYSRMFDISGTAGSHFYFDHTLLTVRPNTFTSNLFIRGQVRMNSGSTLWTARWSAPRPFVQISAAWGALYDNNGHLTEACVHPLVGESPSDAATTLPLQAPYHGLIEPAIGIHELLRLGLCDFGVAVAYPLTPKQAPYHQSDPLQNIAIMAAVRLTIP